MVLAQFLSVPALAICLLTALGVSGIFPWDRRYLLVLGSLLLVVAVATYLLVELQRLPARVFYPLASFPLIVALWYVPHGAASLPSFRFTGRHLVRQCAFLVLVLLLAWVLRGHRLSHHVQASEQRLFFAELERLGPQADQLFVVWRYRTPCAAVRPLTLNPCFRTLRFFDFGTAGRTTNGQRMLREFGITDIHRALQTRTKRLSQLQSQIFRRYRTFLREHYGREITAELYFAEPHFSGLQNPAAFAPGFRPAKRAAATVAEITSSAVPSPFGRG